MDIRYKTRNIKVKAQKIIFTPVVKARLFAEDERGDTNFISILVLLGIALALAAVFLGFKDQVLTWVNSAIAPFFTKTPG